MKELTWGKRHNVSIEFTNNAVYPSDIDLLIDYLTKRKARLEELEAITNVAVIVKAVLDIIVRDDNDINSIIEYNENEEGTLP